MSTGSEFQSGNNHIIFGGGESLPGAPESWEWANAWQEKANEDSPNEQMKWSWDCHFKLDYDGDMVSISSRFYPPAKYYGSKWDGSVAVYVFDDEVHEHKFECETLDQLKLEVEKYVSELSVKVKSLLKPLKKRKLK